MDQKQQIADTLKKFKHAVLATVSASGAPEAAYMLFAETPELSLIFGTRMSSRKYKNISENNKVAFVIGGEQGVTLQYEGIVEQLAESEKEQFEAIYYAKNPEARQWSANPEERMFKVTPKWIRYLDMTKQPMETFEVTF